MRFALWESGGTFLRKFPFYSHYLLKDSDIIVYTISLAHQSEENLTDRIKAVVTQGRSQIEGRQPKEIVLLTKADLAWMIVADE